MWVDLVLMDLEGGCNWCLGAFRGLVHLVGELIWSVYGSGMGVDQVCGWTWCVGRLGVWMWCVWIWYVDRSGVRWIWCVGWICSVDESVVGMDVASWWMWCVGGSGVWTNTVGCECGV